MQFVKTHTSNTLEIKQSKFIAHLLPYDTYKQTLQELQEQHPKARHFVTAYRYLNEFKQVVEHSSDDGEPKGTSGKPSLMVLQGKELINCAVIIVRYFGGTKLGTGGLVRAYSDAVNLVIQESELFVYAHEKSLSIEINYGDVRFVEYECEANDIQIVQKEFNEKVIYTLCSSEKNIEIFLEKTQRVIKTLES